MRRPKDGRGKKLHEVFTIEGYYIGPHGYEQSIDDSRTMIAYDSMDEAINAAKRLEESYKNKKGYKKLEASVCFNEWKYKSGDIYGNRTCLSLKDLGINRRKRK